MAKFFGVSKGSRSLLASFSSISRSGICLVFMKVITPTTYSRNWGLVAPIIVLNFLQEYRVEGPNQGDMFAFLHVNPTLVS